MCTTCWSTAFLRPSFITFLPHPFPLPSSALQVVSFIYFTRIIVYLLESTLPYRYIWLSNAANELATLAFYVACGIKFRPLAAGTNPYFALEQDEIEMAP